MIPIVVSLLVAAASPWLARALSAELARQRKQRPPPSCSGEVRSSGKESERAS